MQRLRKELDVTVLPPKVLILTLENGAEHQYKESPVDNVWRPWSCWDCRVYVALQQLRAWNVPEAALERVCSRVKAHHVHLWVGLFLHVVMESNLYSGGRGQPFLRPWTPQPTDLRAGSHGRELYSSCPPFHPPVHASIQQNLMSSFSVSGTLPGTRDTPVNKTERNPCP